MRALIGVLAAIAFAASASAQEGGLTSADRKRPVRPSIEQRPAFMSRSLWRSGLAFALVGPLIGLAFFLGLVAASGAIARTDLSLLDQALAMLTFVPMLLIGAYAIGAPAAFAVGVVVAHAAGRGVRKTGSFGASLVVGAAVSLLMAFSLDEFVLPHPHDDSTPLLGPQMWLAAAGIGAASAAICSSFFLWRRDRRGGAL
jgi:hypothetical protein